MRFRALFITHSPPRPAISGDRIRTFHLMRELRGRGWHVSLFSLVPPEEPEGLEDALGDAADDWRLVPHRVGRVGRLIKLGAGLVRGRAFQQHWFWSRTAANALRVWLAATEPSVLFVEQLYMYPYVPRSLRRSAVLDTQNLEIARMRAMAAADASPARRTMARLQLGHVARFEVSAVASVGRVLAVSESEQAAFEAMAPGRVRLVPNGVDTHAITPAADPPASRSLLYVGSMSYAPNIDAVTFFVDEIAPLVRSDGVTLDVVGASPAPSVRRAAQAARIPTIVSGYVPDVTPYYADRRAMIVPLRQGGGTRLKILEALARGLPVVTTSVGSAGLGLTHNREALIADTPATFAAAVDRLMADDALWHALSQAGRTYVEQHYDWGAIGAKLDSVMREPQDQA